METYKTIWEKLVSGEYSVTTESQQVEVKPGVSDGLRDGITHENVRTDWRHNFCRLTKGLKPHSFRPEVIFLDGKRLGLISEIPEGDTEVSFDDLRAAGIWPTK